MSSSQTAPSYVQDTVRRIVERYRKRKYLKDKPADPFRKKPTLQTEDLLGLKPYKKRK